MATTHNQHTQNITLSLSSTTQQYNNDTHNSNTDTSTLNNGFNDKQNIPNNRTDSDTENIHTLSNGIQHINIQTNTNHMNKSSTHTTVSHSIADIYEEQRIAAVLEYDISDDSMTAVLNDMVELTASILHTPNSSITIVSRTDVCNKACSNEAWNNVAVPRERTLCSLTIQYDEDVLYISDCTVDSRVATELCVTEPPYVKSYLGAKLITESGFCIGTLCVFDFVPHIYTAEQIKTIQVLGRQVMSQFELKLKYKRLQQAQIELTKAKEKAELAVISKSSFLANMSHEIRTPFNAILGTAAILAESALSEDQLENVKIIQTSSEHLLTICNDILDLSKHESGKMQLENRPFSIIECIESAIELSFKKEKSIDLDCVYIIDTLVPQYIMGDLVRTRQILANLISNACKFTATGTIQITVNVQVYNEQTQQLELQFNCIDTGIGIEQQNIERLFHAFDQVHADLHRYGGTGLGLAISARLVELMGGKFVVTSDVGKGSTFSFTVMTYDGTNAFSSSSTVNTRTINTNNVHHNNMKTTKHTHNISNTPSPIHRHILCYDKNPLVTQSIAHYLEQYNMSVTQCNTSADAVHAMQQAESTVQQQGSAYRPYDCMLVMHDMTHDMDGLQLASELCKHRRLNNTSPNSGSSFISPTTTQLPQHSFLTEPSPLVQQRAVSDTVRSTQPWLHSQHISSPATSLSSLRQFDNIAATQRVPISPQVRIRPQQQVIDTQFDTQKPAQSMNAAHTSPQSVRMPVIYLLCESIDKMAISPVQLQYEQATTNSTITTPAQQNPNLMPYAIRKPIRLSKLVQIIEESIANPTRRQRTLQQTPANTTVLDKQLADKYPCSILLVDDNKVNIKIALKLLTLMGYRNIDCVYDGTEAVEIVCQQRKPYDIIFMDLTMPKLSGCDASRRIIEFYSSDSDMLTSKLPVIIAMSAAVMNEDRVACVSAGLNDFVSKPISIQGLQNTIKKWMRNTANSTPSPSLGQRRIAR